MFARAPVPGRAKTRLEPRLGPWRAARLQARLTLAALRTARAAHCGPVELHGSARHAFFEGKGTFRLQRGADLGERMQHAFRAALRRHRRAILIGSDAPSLRAADLRRAARWLQGGCDAVLAPAEDGGYALLGLRRLPPRLFEGIAWGGNEVYSATVRRLGAARWRALRTVWDVDRPADLERLGSVRI